MICTIKRYSLPLFVILVLSPITAFALSCAVPRLNEQIISDADIIFEGVVISKRELGFLEKLSLSVQIRGGDVTDLRVYDFAVTHGWKGAMAGQNIKIVRNTYWGDGFRVKDTPYLVVSTKKVKDFYYVHLCGPTMPLAYYKNDSPIKEMRGQLNVLKELIGEGFYIKIKPSDMACQADSDCDGIQTHCGQCSCGTPVNKLSKLKYMKLFKATCSDIGAIENCEMTCEILIPRCINGICVLY